MMNQSKDDQTKKDEARREEQERRQLEDLLHEFDAYSFYDTLGRWIQKRVPSPIPQTVHVTPLRQKVILHQPLPVTRRDMSEVRKISSDAARLLYLLRAIDQKGIECPYIHLQNRSNLEKAVEKCDQIKEAGKLYYQGIGFWASLRRLFNKPHLDGAKQDVEFFKNRLEAILMMCRHQEFAKDLMNFRKTVTHDSAVDLETAPAKGSSSWETKKVPSTGSSGSSGSAGRR
jgi:hypothetical protein